MKNDNLLDYNSIDEGVRTMFEKGYNFSMRNVFNEICRDMNFKKSTSGYQRDENPNPLLNHNLLEETIKMSFGDFSNPFELFSFCYIGGEVKTTHYLKSKKEGFMKYRMPLVKDRLLQSLTESVRKNNSDTERDCRVITTILIPPYNIYNSLKAIIEHSDIKLQDQNI